MAITCEPWLTRTDVCTDSDVSPAIVNTAIASATSWLYEATCGRFTGVCTTTLRPRRLCGDDDGGCHDRPQRYQLDLSPWVNGPILTIEAVTVDGVEVDAEDYRLVNSRWLVAHEDGALRPWPAQHLDRPDGDEGTWSVTVTHGRVPPPEVVDAAADLAKQLIAKCTGGDCLLPDNATSISRDGVTVELNVPTDGKTGLPLVGSIVAMYACRRTRRIHDPAAPVAEVLPGA